MGESSVGALAKCARSPTAQKRLLAAKRWKVYCPVESNTEPPAATIAVASAHVIDKVDGRAATTEALAISTATTVRNDLGIESSRSAHVAVDDKLYVNVNEAAQKRWLDDIPAHIQRANAAWPSIADKAPQELN